MDFTRKFPDSKVSSAYLHPITNQDNEKFLWKYPSQEKVSQYCQHILGWTQHEINAQVTPVLKKFMEKSIQTRIDQHFITTYQDNSRFARLQVIV